MKPYHSLLRFFWRVTLSAALVTSCDELPQDTNTSSEGGTGTVASATSTDTLSNRRIGFIAQGPVQLNHSGIVESVDGRILAKLDEFEGETSFLDENQPSDPVLSLLGDVDPKDQEPANEPDKISDPNYVDDEQSSETLAETLAKIKTLLNERILIEANIARSSATEVVYLLKGADFCENNQEEFMLPSQSEENHQHYQNCVEMVDRLIIKIRFTAPDSDTITAEALIGPDELAPVKVSASSTALSVTLDVEQIPGVVSLVSAIAPNPIPVNFPAAWKGQLVMSMSKVGDRVYQLKAEAAQGLLASASISPVFLAWT
jgi:hypothetical protein